MTIQVQCSECQENYRLRDDFAGKTVKCRKCGGQFMVPKSTAVPSTREWSEDLASPAPKPVSKPVVARPNPTSSPKPGQSKSLTSGTQTTTKTKSPAPTAKPPETKTKPRPPPKPKPKELEVFDEDFIDDEEEDSFDEYEPTLPRRKPKPKAKVAAKRKSARSRSYVPMPGIIVFLLVMTLLSAGLDLLAIFTAKPNSPQIQGLGGVISMIRLFFTSIHLGLLLIRWRICWYILRILNWLAIVLFMLCVIMVLLSASLMFERGLGFYWAIAVGIYGGLFCFLAFEQWCLGSDHVRAYYSFDGYD